MTIQPVEWLDEFQVNNSSNAAHNTPSITQLTNGNVLIVWSTSDDTGAGSSPGRDIIGQIFDPLGNQVGSEFQLNSLAAADDEQAPSITALPNGGFTMTYIDGDQVSGNTFSTRVVVESFNASGAPTGGVFTVAALTATGLVAYENPTIAVASNSNSLIVWEDNVNGDILGQRYNPQSGSLDGPQLTLFSDASGPGEGTAGLDVITLANGNFMVAQANQNASTNDEIQVRVVGANGTLLGGAQTVYSALPSAVDPSMTLLSDGRVAIAWTVDNAGATDAGVRVSILNANGTVAVGGVNGLNPATTVADDQVEPEVVGLQDGGFVVFWADRGTSDLHGQRYNSSGSKVGGEFDVENWSSIQLSNIDAVLLEDGRVQITWEEDFSSGNIYSAIWDPRTAANSSAADGYIIGTPGSDTINSTDDAEIVVGDDGNDRIIIGSADQDDADYDGGLGTDTLVFGSFTANISFSGLGTGDVTNFEEFEFESQFVNIVRNIFFTADQASQFATIDFDGSSLNSENFQVIMGMATTFDLSGV
ncbi:MAG: hypothetical protein AAGI92_12855, partial [Pseudomonadota bacterium]